MDRTEAQWTALPATEKENYLSFHKIAFEEDLKHAEKNAFDFPRWSIISAYYGMHDLTKLFLAAKFNIKISSPDIHVKTIEALEYFISGKDLKNKLLQMLKQAKDAYFNAERLKERTLPLLLKRGKQERGKAQYYSQDYTEKDNVNAQKAMYFLKTIVNPYVEILKGMIE